MRAYPSSRGGFSRRGDPDWHQPISPGLLRHARNDASAFGTTLIVMAALDAAIHGKSYFACNGAWMAGSSPAMTTLAVVP